MDPEFMAGEVVTYPKFKCFNCGVEGYGIIYGFGLTDLHAIQFTGEDRLTYVCNACEKDLTNPR